MENKEESTIKIGKRLKYIIVPVCMIIIIAVIGIKQSNLLERKIGQNIEDKEWKVKEIYLDNLKAEENLAIIPKWDEKTITQKFSCVKYLNEQYDNNRNTKISSERIGKKLGEATLNGYDTYTKTTYSINANLYEVAEFPKKCVIAVQFEEDNNYYVYINSHYRPETLGDFVKDLKLKDIVSFGTVRYNYGYIDSKGKRQYEKIEFYDVDNEMIWKMLFNDLSLKNIYKDSDKYRSDYLTQEITISVDIPLFGIKDISVSLTDKGYLITNIWETGKCFYIGEEKVQEFINYVIQNYDGYKIVYVDKKSDEDKKASKNEYEDTTIITKDLINNTVYINQN